MLAYMRTTDVKKRSKILKTLKNVKNVAWQCYLGEVKNFYSTLWLIYARHCMNINFYQNRSSIVEVVKKAGCFMPHSVCI